MLRGMSRRTWIWALLALWAGVYAASFLVAWQTTPNGDGFTRGLNRVMVFFQFQIAAGVLALVIWRIGMSRAKGSALRWLSRLPALMAAALVALIAALILYAAMIKPAPGGYTPPQQTVTPDAVQ